MKKGLYIVATPIGNLGDISARAIQTLQDADVIACEDSRVTRKLFTLLNINLKKRFITLEDHNEAEQAQNIINLIINEGLSVAQVSDAGSPLISDPGYKLIRACRQQGVDVFAVPGACALICALQLSGLPTNRFMFAGFIPNRDKARVDTFSKFKDLDATLIFYETAPRLLKTLAAAGTVFGDREMAVAREISKLYEECRSGTFSELSDHYTAHEPRGEIVFMVAPATEATKSQIDLAAVLRLRLPEMSLKTAVKSVVDEYGLNKNEVYEQALQVKDELKSL